MRYAESSSKNRAIKMICRAVAPPLAQSVVRAAPGGGAYTQN